MVAGRAMAGMAADEYHSVIVGGLAACRVGIAVWQPRAGNITV